MLNESIFIENLSDKSQSDITSLKKLGKFYKSGTDMYFYVNETKQLFYIPLNADDGHFDHYLNLNLGLSKGVNHFIRRYQNIKTFCYQFGNEATIYTLYHYSKLSNTLYISNNDNPLQIYRIKTNKIELVDNGTDGILFISNSEFEPIKVNLDGQFSLDSIAKLYLDRIWYKTTDAIFSKPEYRYILLNYIILMLFESELVEKPILIFQGEKGVGKTTTARMIGTILQGKKFREITLRKDQRDFLSAVINNRYLLIDNIDDNPPNWFLDSLASITTGGSIQGRKLYTDINTPPLSIIPSTFIALTSRKPLFNRDDISSRSIIIRLERQGNAYDSTFIKGIMENRNKIWGEIMHRAQTLLNRIENKNERVYKHSFRMVDYAELTLVYSKNKEKTLETLERIVQEQITLVLESEEWIVKFINHIKTENKFGKPFRASEIKDLVKDFDESLSSEQIGRKLRKYENEIQALIHMEIVVSGNNSTYYFNKK